MKKAVIFLAAGMFLLACLPAFTQENAYPKDAFVKSVPITKVWVHPLGYEVVYFKSNMQPVTIYVPLKWFDYKVGKAEIVYGNNRAYPYFSIFWVDGKFQYIRLYVLDYTTSPTWGVDDGTKTDLTGKFNIQELSTLEF